MQAEIITIGDEILIGQILDSNSKWIAEELNKIGVTVYQITSIQDDKKHIVTALEQAKMNSDIIIITGGLGSTNDDITKLTLTNYFNDELLMNEEIFIHIKNMFAKANYSFTEVNQQQALLPSKCIPLKNNYGTASGMWFNFDEKIIISLPGVPNEMKGLMQDEVLPKLKKDLKLPFIIHKTILTYGMGESMVAEQIADWEQNLHKNIKLAYLPNYGSVKLRLTAKGEKENNLKSIIEFEVEKLVKIIPNIIVGFEESHTLEYSIGKLLSKKNKTIAVAESCTGGNIAHKITSINGASNYFIGGVVAYNSALKVKELNVNPDLLAMFSVVSSEVVEAMAVGIQKKYDVDYAIATTGNAGPTTDETDASVGVVYIGIATRNDAFSKKFFFGKPREKVIERATNKALELLREEILKN